MQNIWADTDRPVIDRMKSRNSRLSSNNKHDCFTSSDDSSDSDHHSEASFLAVPPEFRPSPIAKQSIFTKRSAGTKSLATEISKPLDPLKHQVSQNIPPNQIPTKNIHERNHNPANPNFLQKTNKTANKNNTTEADERRRNVIEVIFPKEKNDCLKIVDKTGVSKISVEHRIEKKVDLKLDNANVETLKVKKKNVPGKIEFEIKYAEPVTVTESEGIVHDSRKAAIDKRTLKSDFKYQNNKEIQKDLGAKPKQKNLKRNKRSNEFNFNSMNVSTMSQNHKPIKWDSMINFDDSKICSQSLNPSNNEVSIKKIEWSIGETRIHKEIEMSDHYCDSRENLNYSRDFQEKSAKKEQSYETKYKMQNTAHNLAIPKDSKLNENGSSEFNFLNNRLRNKKANTNRTQVLYTYNNTQDNSNKYTTAEDIYDTESEFINQTSFLRPIVKKDNPKLQLIDLSEDNKNQFSSLKRQSNVTVKNASALEDKNLIINFGKDMSDLVIGSHIAFSTLFSIYTEWKQSRNELINQFQHLENTMQESSQQYQKYRDLLRVGTGAATLAAAIPNPYVSMAAKIVSAITGLVSTFFKSKNGVNINIDELEVKTLLLKDIDNSSELFMHGLQCNMQFQETRNVIEDFHTKAYSSRDKVCLDIQTFIQGFLEYTPKHHIFYKKLHKCYKELLERNSLSPYSKHFCEPFSLYNLKAVDVIQYLDWKFIEIDNVSVENELRDIQELIQNSNGLISVKELASKIKNCVRILNDELERVNKCMSKISLFDHSELNSKQK